jgi:hypothetical protein
MDKLFFSADHREEQTKKSETARHDRESTTWNDGVACGEGAEDLEGGRGDDSYVQGSGILGIYSDSECRS